MMFGRPETGLFFHDRCGAHGGGSWLLSVSDITCLPFEDASFDLVICSEVLEHIPDEKTAVREIIRVLKPGGTLVVSVPRYFPERICWALSDAYHQTANGHIRIYRKQQLVRLLEAQGAVYQFKSFCPQHSFPVLVAEMSGRTRAHGCGYRERVSPVSDLGYPQKAQNHPVSGCAV